MNPALPVALQRGIRSALNADPDIARLIGARVYDRVPTSGVAYPYIVIGDDEITDDANTCVDSVIATCGVHVWSQAPRTTEAKEIGGYVHRALDNLGSLSIDGHDVIAGGFVSQSYRPGPDGLLTEGVIVFRYDIDPVTNI